jgi:hypothetical protein
MSQFGEGPASEWEMFANKTDCKYLGEGSICDENGSTSGKSEQPMSIFRKPRDVLYL